jgi:REP element-mobilizing transposase RayT
LFLRVLADVCERFNWWGHAYCLMTNHYHLLMETPDANLANGMRQLNGVSIPSGSTRFTDAAGPSSRVGTRRSSCRRKHTSRNWRATSC